MAMTRKALKAMGLTEEQVDSIIEMHLEVKNGLEEQMKAYKADAEKLPNVQKELDDLKKGDGQDWKSKYEAEKTAHEKTKSDYTAMETAATNEKLFRDVLTSVGIMGKRADQIVKMTDMTQFTVKNGVYEDANAVEKHVREEYSEFVPTKETKGANVPNPPGNSGGKMTKEQIASIKDPAERRAAIAENIETFNLGGQNYG